MLNAIVEVRRLILLFRTISILYVVLTYDILITNVIDAVLSEIYGHEKIPS